MLRKIGERFRCQGPHRAARRPRSIATIRFRATCGQQMGAARPARHHRGRGAFGGAGLGYLERIAWRWRKISRAIGLRSACLTGRIPIFASTSSAATAKRCTEEEISAQADFRRPCRRAGDVGTWRRFRRGIDAHACRQKGRPLHPQWLEDVDQQRPESPTRWWSMPRPTRTAGRARASRPSSSKKGMKGFSPAQKLDKLGMRGSDTCELVFEPIARCRRECAGRGR